MVMPPAGDVEYLTARPGRDAARAVARMRRPSDAGPPGDGQRRAWCPARCAAVATQTTTAAAGAAPASTATVPAATATAPAAHPDARPTADARPDTTTAGGVGARDPAGANA